MNIWDYAPSGWIVIPTNGIVKLNGEAVMGAGLALQAAERFPALPKKLGERLKKSNEVQFFEEYWIVTFPTKHDWKAKSDLDLIIRSAAQLASYANMYATINRHNRDKKLTYYIPHVGCGLGGLQWKDVWPAIYPYLNKAEFIFI